MAADQEWAVLRADSHAMVRPLASVASDRYGIEQQNELS